MDEIPFYKDSKGKGLDIFCAKCLSHESTFIPDGSHQINGCNCGTFDFIVWHKMSIIQKFKAKRKQKNEGNKNEN